MDANNLPLLPPVRVSVPAGTTRVISFPNEFFGSAVSVQLQNEDGANAATYRYGGETQPFKQLPAGSTRTIDQAIINLLEVVAGAAGAVVVEAQVLIDVRSNNPTKVV